MVNPTRTVHRTCPLCEATCGVSIDVEQDRVVRIRGDRDDVFSRGFVCPKGTTLGKLHHDPDWLREPLVAEVDPETGVRRHRRVSWDEAFARVDELLAPLLTEDRNSVALYLGNPNVHHLANSIYTRPLIKALGTSNLFSASTVDQMPKHVSCGLMFGDPLGFPVPDVDRCDHLLSLIHI